MDLNPDSRLNRNPERSQPMGEESPSPEIGFPPYSRELNDSIAYRSLVAKLKDSAFVPNREALDSLAKDFGAEIYGLLIAALGERNPIWKKASKSLARLGASSFDSISEALEQGDSRLRIRALSTLMKFNVRECSPFLLAQRALSDPEPLVRAKAIKLLIRIERQSQYPDRHRLEALLSPFFDDSNALVRGVVDRAIDKPLTVDEAEQMVRKFSRQGLGKDQIIRLTQHSNRTIVALAVGALAEAHLGLALRRIESSDHSEREDAARRLGRADVWSKGEQLSEVVGQLRKNLALDVNSLGSPNADLTTERISRYLTSEFPIVRKAMLSLIPGIRCQMPGVPSEFFEGAIISRCDDPNEAVGVYATKLLGKVLGSRATPILLTFLAGESSSRFPDYRASAAEECLGQLQVELHSMIEEAGRLSRLNPFSKASKARRVSDRILTGRLRRLAKLVGDSSQGAFPGPSTDAALEPGGREHLALVANAAQVQFADLPPRERFRAYKLLGVRSPQFAANEALRERFDGLLSRASKQHSREGLITPGHWDAYRALQELEPMIGQIISNLPPYPLRGAVWLQSAEQRFAQRVLGRVAGCLLRNLGRDDFGLPRHLALRIIRDNACRHLGDAIHRESIKGVYPPSTRDAIARLASDRFKRLKMPKMKVAPRFSL